MNKAVSLQAIIARIAEIDQIVSPKPPVAPSSTTGQSGFLTSLNGVQQGSSLAAPAAAPAAGGGASGALAAAQAEV